MMLKGNFWICLVVLFIIPWSGWAKNDGNMESVSGQLEQLRHNPDNLPALHDVCFYYLKKSDYNKAILYADKLLTASSSAGNDRYRVYAEICLGQAYTMTGNIKEAFRNLSHAELMGVETKNDSALCSVYNGLGLYALNIQNDYYRSLDYFFKGIDIARRLSYDRLYSILLNNIAGVYYLKNDITGLKYAIECRDLGRKWNDIYLLYTGSITMAYMYSLGKNYQMALKSAGEAEEIMVRNDFYDKANIYNVYGAIYADMGKDEQAIAYFKKSLKPGEANNITSVMGAYLGYARILMKQHKYDRAVTLLEKGLQISYENAMVVFRSDLLKELSECYERRGMLSEALKYHKIYNRETDSLYNAERERASMEVRVKYDMDKQENEIRNSRMELLKKENKMNLLVIGLICFIIIASLLYYLYYRKNKLYLAIVRQNQDAIGRENQLRLIISKQKEKLDSCTVSNFQSEKYAASSLSDERKMDLFQRLEKLLAEDKIYSDNLLTKEKVAEMLGTNRTYLSQIINEHTSQTFTQFVNGFRIQEAVRILSDPENSTPLKAVSAELGFNSTTTFYNQFQAVTGMTPTQYRNKVKNLHKNS
ncbi:helix-turn-helix domain-containing protein [Bacteroides ilei]|uniref:helix-turn-helix domain-containing protein n=1 Tax=Bacteroides ilei TaxID=1907658 RepID=UPI003AB143FC